MNSTNRLIEYINTRFSEEAKRYTEAMIKFQAAYENAIPELKQVYSTQMMAKAQTLRALENLKTDLLLNIIVNYSTAHNKEEIKI